MRVAITLLILFVCMVEACAQTQRRARGEAERYRALIETTKTYEAQTRPPNPPPEPAACPCEYPRGGEGESKMTEDPKQTPIADDEIGLQVFALIDGYYADASEAAAARKWLEKRIMAYRIATEIGLLK